VSTPGCRSAILDADGRGFGSVPGVKDSEVIAPPSRKPAWILPSLLSYCRWCPIVPPFPPSFLPPALTSQNLSVLVLPPPPLIHQSRIDQTFLSRDLPKTTTPAGNQWSGSAFGRTSHSRFAKAERVFGAEGARVKKEKIETRKRKKWGQGN